MSVYSYFCVSHRIFHTVNAVILEKRPVGMGIEEGRRTGAYIYFAWVWWLGCNIVVIADGGGRNVEPVILHFFGYVFSCAHLTCIGNMETCA